MSALRSRMKNIAHEALINYKRHFVKKQWRAIVIKNTECKLTDDQKKAVDEIYAPYYKKMFYGFHEYYTENNGTFYANYMPDDLYYNYVDRYYNDWEKATLFDNKCLYSLYFSGVKMPRTILTKMNGMLFDSNHTVISKDYAQKLLEKEPEVFIKIATESDGGRGVYCISGVDDIHRKALEIIFSTKSDVIAQEPIKQHPQMAKLNSSSVNSIRVLSLLSETGVKVYSVIVRMGMSGCRVDNVSNGAISCGVDEFGKLRKFAYGCYGGKTDRHPTSNVEFLGFQLPNFDGVIEAAKKLFVVE